MSMYAQQFRSRIRLVEHNIVRAYELPRATDIDAETKHIAIVYSVRVGVFDAEGRDTCAGAIKILLIMAGLLSDGG